MKLGVIQFYDNEEGYIIDFETRETFYLHSSAMKNMPFVGEKRKYNGMPVTFSLYTNLYMSQVDDVRPVSLMDIAKFTGPIEPGQPWGYTWNNFIDRLKESKIGNEAYLNNHKIFVY